MQVILLQNVARVGKKFDVVDVSNGFANNYLFPRKLAERTTPDKVATLEARKAKIAEKEAQRIAATKEKLEALGDTEVRMSVKADDQGHLFKKIRAEDIAHTLKQDHELDIKKESVLLDTPLHEVGTHDVVLEVEGVRATITLTLTKE